MDTDHPRRDMDTDRPHHPDTDTDRRLRPDTDTDHHRPLLRRQDITEVSEAATEEATEVPLPRRRRDIEEDVWDVRFLF